MENNDLQQRKCLRLEDYNYSTPGWYYVTVCVEGRMGLFGNVNDKKIELNDFGWIVEKCWIDLQDHYFIDLDEYVVMPNHFHGIIQIKNNEHTKRAGDINKRAGHRPAPTARYGLTEIIRAFKSYSSQRINLLRDTIGLPIWQRGFYDRIIRSNEDLNRIRKYIQDNPANWKQDKFNPDLD